MERLSNQMKVINKKPKIIINTTRHQYQGSECGMFSIILLWNV